MTSQRSLIKATKKQEREDPRQEVEGAQDAEVKEDDKMEDGAEEFNIGSPLRERPDQEEGEEDWPLEDGPNQTSDRRFNAPERNPAKNRSKHIHEDEPHTTNIFLGDEDLMEASDGMLEIEKANRREDQLIVSRAFLGHDLHEAYSNKRMLLASNRSMVDSLCKIGSVDVSEMFSPERVTKVCKENGLVPGQAMDLKNGFDFDRPTGTRRGSRSSQTSRSSSSGPHRALSSPSCRT